METAAAGVNTRDWQRPRAERIGVPTLRVWRRPSPAAATVRGGRRAAGERVEADLYWVRSASQVGPLWRAVWRLRAAAIARWRQVDLAAGRAVKRGIDLAVASGCLLATAPLLGLVAALIKLTDGGPVLFWQVRVGRHGRAFAFPKFRSMVVGADRLKDQLVEQSEGRVRFKMKRDPRVTWIGRILRRLSIDELPQLWNVLTGDMTLVGPRPPVPREVAQYSLRDRRRLDVTPGLTCFWQVSGRSDIPFEQQVELDAEYIERRCLRLDVQLLLRTVPAVLTGRGAY